MTKPQPSLPADSSSWRPAALLICGLIALYWFLSPAVIQGDGIGYLKQLHGESLSPGHLAYLPLIRAMVGSYSHVVLLDLVAPLRWMSIAFAAGALLLFWGCARVLFPAREALFGTALLGLCHAFSRSAAEVEVYAAASFFATALLWSLIRFALAQNRNVRAAWATLAGACCGLGAMFHLTLIFLGPSMVGLLLLWAPPGRRVRAAAVGILSAALVLGAPLLLILQREGHTTLTGALAWLSSADHGLPYPVTWYTPAVALYGAAKSLVFAPYPHEASWIMVGGLTTLGLLCWGALALLRAQPRAPQVGWPLVLIWCLPLAGFALLFYPSDTERWIFLLPAICLFLTPRAGIRSATVIAAVALANILATQLPLALDREPLTRAAAAERLLGPLDLVISPGHGWDELIGLGLRRPPRRFPLIYFVGATGGTRQAIERMRQEVSAARARGGQVFVARLEDMEDPRGFKELAWFSVTARDFRALFEEESPRVTEAPGLWRLSGRKRPDQRRASPSPGPR